MPSSDISNDGEIKMWVDEELIYHAYNCDRHSGGTNNFTGMNFYPSSEASEDFEHWMDEMVIYEGYVPPSGVPSIRWYEDEDGDGYHAGVSQLAESDPGADWYELGDLTGGGDCDDSDAAKSPGGTEAGNCSDGKDNDCDGDIDEADSECAAPAGTHRATAVITTGGMRAVEGAGGMTIK